MRIIERITEQYEAVEVEDFGRVYKWRPEKVVVECNGCAKRTTFEKSKLLTSIVACDRCSAKSTAGIREELLVELPIPDEDAHPWRYWSPREGTGIPF